jgi:hypothetical protein
LKIYERPGISWLAGCLRASEATPLYMDIYCASRSKVVVEWLTLLHHIREITGSDLDPETGYRDRFFVFFVSHSPGEYLDSTLKLDRDHFLQNPSELSFTLSHDDV